MAETPAVDIEKWRHISKSHFSKITSYYDQGRAFEQGKQWVDEIQQHTPAAETDWVLDAGCGTGLFATEFAYQLNAHVLGIEPSSAMLQQALKKEKPAHLWFTQGMAEALPLANGTLQAVFLSQVWHHLTGQERAGREFFRCLKPGGGLYIKTYSHSQLRARWDLREIFPELMPLMLNIYPDVPQMTGLLESIGFSPVTAKTMHKEDFITPSKMLKLMHEKAWSMFSFLSPDGKAQGEARLQALVDSGDLPVAYPEVHLLMIARR